MRLKKLTLHGFKSFADRTDLDFTPGVTTVVGPNGCGKSNIVDAVKWVLGEQSAKSLRGRQMTDVIFNGSTGRKSMGMAEVCLTFETNGELADFGGEVAISRRLYRSGQSEYLINNKPGRLRDIRDLFLDTGVGTDAYSLIEQGKVDLLLQASNQERRTVLEEAAGISKYKVRRKEAQRRLDNVEQNLLRVSDVIAEVEKHLRSVKYQAGKARHYQEYTTRLGELKAQYYLSEYHNLMDHQGRLRVDLDELHEQLQNMESEHDLLEAGRSQLDLENVELTNRITRIENQLTETTGRIDSGRQTITLLTQRMSEQKEHLEHARRRLQSQHFQIDRIQEEQRQVNEQLSGLQGEELDLQTRIDGLRDCISEHEGKLGELLQRLETEKSNLIELLRKTSRCNNQITQLESEQNNLTGQKDRLWARQNVLAGEQHQITSQRDEQQRTVEQTDQQIESLRSKVNELQGEHTSLITEAGELARTVAGKKEQRSAIASRLELLADMETQMQGIGSGAKKLLKLKEQSDPAVKGLIGLVADVIRTDLDHAQWIELALAGRDQYLVVENSSFVDRQHDLLVALGGAVHILALDLLSPIVHSRDYSASEGVVGLASDFVKTDERFERLVRVLLGKTLIVDDLATAIRLRKEDTGGWRFVTTDGQLLEDDGSVRVGPNKPDAGLIWRKSELGHLEKQLAELDRVIDELARKAEQVSERQHATGQTVNELNSELHRLQTERAQDCTTLSNLDEQLRKIGQEAPLLTSEIDAVSRQAESNDTRRGEAQKQLAELEAQQQRQQQLIDELQSSCQQQQSTRETMNAELTELKVNAARLAQKHQASTERIGSLQSALTEAQSAYQSAEEEIQTDRLHLEQAERQVLQTESRLAQWYLDKQQLQDQSAQLRSQRLGKNDQLQKLAAQEQQLKSHIAEKHEHTQQLALKINELTVRQETLIQRVQEELNVDIERAYNEYKPDQQDWQALEAEIHELKAKIERLGNVNLDAIAEQEELEARLVFLTSQRDDLEKARKKLEELIGRLDEESRVRFIETFEAVRENFQELFRKLFGGGKADIVLDNPEDVLESGIDILARPPGKETRSVTLLSGGEKTLTTVALLMAIFKSKPSPFCILDEIDAALDDANVDRFNMVLQGFLEHSQFVIITHNKRTMSYADALYGITMQEAGVSKKVAVRFDKHDSVEDEKDTDEESEAA